MPPERQRTGRATLFLAQNAGLVLVFIVLLLALVAYSAIFWSQQQALPGLFELTSTVDNTMPLVLTAVGQTIVVLTRGLDLSVGGIVDLTNAVAAVHIHDDAGSMLLWSAIVLLIGAGLGLINGLLVGVGRLQPILVTLATLSIFQGLAIRALPSPGGAIPPGYTAALVNQTWPTALLFVVGLALLWMALRRSAPGVAMVAIGNDEEAAQAQGIDPIRTKLLAYMLSGLCAGAAGLFLAANATAGDATSGDGLTLASIVAVVLGGVSLFGGRGSAVGAIAGAFLTTMIVNLLFFLRIDPLYQSFYEGLFLVIAVLLSALVGRVLRRR